MRFHGIANPSQLEILNQALEEHCASRGISDPVGRDELAEFILTLFSRGLSSLEEIGAALSVSAERDTGEQA